MCLPTPVVLNPHSASILYINTQAGKAHGLALCPQSQTTMQKSRPPWKPRVQALPAYKSPRAAARTLYADVLPPIGSPTIM